MAKMMMGQIDHARARVAQIKAEKLGPTVRGPKILGGNDLLKEMRTTPPTRSVTPAQLKTAFRDYIDEVTSSQVDETTGRYPDYISTYLVKRKPPASVHDALATAIYLKQNTAEVNRFDSETEVYKLRQEALNLEASTVEDAIVLGDQKEALLALNNFAAFIVGF